MYQITIKLFLKLGWTGQSTENHSLIGDKRGPKGSTPSTKESEKDIYLVMLLERYLLALLARFIALIHL